MKTKLLLVVGLFTLTTYAQNENSRKETFSIRAGANYSMFDSTTDWKSGIGYGASVDVDVPLTDKISFVTGLDYTVLKSTYDFSNITEFKSKINILSTKANIRYHFSDKLSVELGPQLNYFTGFIKNKYAEGNPIRDFENNKPLEYIERFDFGPNIGLRYNLTKKIFVQGSYYYGLNVMDKRPNQFNVFTDSNIGKVSFASLSIGLKL